MSGFTAQDAARHADLLARRVAKNERRLGARFARRGIEAYRLYDRDIPEVRAVVDRYADHLVVAEYTRRQTEAVPGYLEQLGRAAAAAVGVPQDNLHLKRRRTGARGARYDRLDRTERRIEVSEGDLRLWVNLDDYTDTGLFADHRETRRMVAGWAAGRTLLNLFGYTGAFTCAAGRGGASHTTTVDLSRTYLDWAADNLALNGLNRERHALVRAEAMSFLADAAQRQARFDVAVVDPPSFSSKGAEADWDVQRDHRALLEAVRAVMRPGGVVLFSTNHQRFEPDLDGLRVEEITDRTVPEDYRNRAVHRAFRLDVDG